MRREDATELFWALNDLLSVQPEQSLGPAHDAAIERACAILAVCEGRQPMRYARKPVVPITLADGSVLSSKVPS